MHTLFQHRTTCKSSGQLLAHLEGLSDFFSDTKISLNFSAVDKRRHFVHVRQTALAEDRFIDLDIQDLSDELGVQADLVCE